MQVEMNAFADAGSVLLASGFRLPAVHVWSRLQMCLHVIDTRVSIQHKVLLCQEQKQVCDYQNLDNSKFIYVTYGDAPANRI
jgi:hypothetical protein